MIHVEALSKNFGTVRAVRNISFDVERGEVVGLLGPNGAGKSTTMRMLTSYLEPDGGIIEIADMNINEYSLEIRKRIGYLPEDAPLYHEMDVIDYLNFIADIREIDNVSRTKRIREIAELCGISRELYRGIGELSKGFKQRVGLAQALIHNPDILILDEPTSGLDPNQIVEIRDLIRRIGEERTVILSTHILSEVQATCDRAMIINQGKIVANGSIEYLQNSVSNETRFNVEIDGPADKISEMLSEINGVQKIHSIKSNDNGKPRFEFITNVNNDVRPIIFHKVVENNWILLEMSGQKLGLEDVFRQLTTDKDAVALVEDNKSVADSSNEGGE